MTGVSNETLQSSESNRIVPSDRLKIGHGGKNLPPPRKRAVPSLLLFYLLLSSRF